MGTHHSLADFASDCFARVAKHLINMDISNPRRILAVSLEGSEQHLSRVIKGNALFDSCYRHDCMGCVFCGVFGISTCIYEMQVTVEMNFYIYMLPSLILNLSKIYPLGLQSHQSHIQHAALLLKLTVSYQILPDHHQKRHQRHWRAQLMTSSSKHPTTQPPSRYG